MIEGINEEIIEETVPHSDRLLLSAKAAADMLSISQRTLVKLPIRQTRIKGVRKVLWRRADLEDFVRSLSER